MLVSMREMLAYAKKNHYAIPAFDVSNYEMMKDLKCLIALWKKTMDCGALELKNIYWKISDNQKKNSESCSFFIKV